MTFGGSVDSIRLKNSVHEKIRLSIRVLASRAAAGGLERITVDVALDGHRVARRVGDHRFRSVSALRKLGVAPRQPDRLGNVERGQGEYQERDDPEAEMHESLVVEWPR